MARPPTAQHALVHLVAHMNHLYQRPVTPNEIAEELTLSTEKDITKNIAKSSLRHTLLKAVKAGLLNKLPTGGYVAKNDPASGNELLPAIITRQDLLLLGAIKAKDRQKSMLVFEPNRDIQGGSNTNQQVFEIDLSLLGYNAAMSASQQRATKVTITLELEADHKRLNIEWSSDYFAMEGWLIEFVDGKGITLAQERLERGRSGQRLYTARRLGFDPTVTNYKIRFRPLDRPS